MKANNNLTTRSCHYAVPMACPSSVHHAILTHGATSVSRSIHLSHNIVRRLWHLVVGMEFSRTAKSSSLQCLNGLGIAENLQVGISFCSHTSMAWLVGSRSLHDVKLYSFLSRRVVKLRFLFPGESFSNIHNGLALPFVCLCKTCCPIEVPQFHQAVEGDCYQA